MDSELDKLFVPGGRAADEEFKKKFLLKLMASAWSLGPFLLGATILTALWAFNIRSGLSIFAGLALILGAVGVFFTRLLTGGEKEKRATIEELAAEARDRQERMLNELYARLKTDNDPRTEGYLNDLRALAAAFHGERNGLGALNAYSAFDVIAGVGQLFNRCVAALEKSYGIWKVATEMKTSAARKELLKSREKIINDVGESIAQLGKILAGIESLGADSEGRDPEIARLRAELDQSLKVAQNVENRVRTLETEIGIENLDKNKG